MTTTCSICNTPFEGAGHNPRPLLTPATPCCDACNRSVIEPLRRARLVAYEGALRVAEFALMLAKQRAMLPPQPSTPPKEMALLAATGMVVNAVEGLHAEQLSGHGR